MPSDTDPAPRTPGVASGAHANPAVEDAAFLGWLHSAPGNSSYRAIEGQAAGAILNALGQGFASGYRAALALPPAEPNLGALALKLAKALARLEYKGTHHYGGDAVEGYCPVCDHVPQSICGQTHYPDCWLGPLVAEANKSLGDKYGDLPDEWPAEPATEWVWTGESPGDWKTYFVECVGGGARMAVAAKYADVRGISTKWLLAGTQAELLVLAYWPIPITPPPSPSEGKEEDHREGQ